MRPPSATGPGTAPVVSVLITAHNRAHELRETLRALKRQDYPAIELIVVDDASDQALEPVVRAEWPGARFERNVRNLGYIVNRSSAMASATGEYLLTLDDDSHPVDADTITRAVARMEREPEIGVLAFRVHEGPEPPDRVAPEPRERYTHAFIGCGVMMRTAAVREVGGYRDDFEYYKEEAEYSLRVLDRGWRILYFPDVVVHHRLSSIGRSDARLTAYSFRNAVWTALLDLPLGRVAVEVPWKLAVGGLELLRKGDARWVAWGVTSTLRGLPRVLRDRAPISARTARLYDVLRFRDVGTAAALDTAKPPSLRERWIWFRNVWMRRRRGRAFWDKRAGGVGEGTWTTRASNH